MANAIALKHLTAQDEKAIADKIEFDDGQSTDITSEMLLECVRKEGAHDDLSQMLAADLSGRKIALINRLKDCHKLRLLDLSYNRISSTRGLDSLHQLRELRLTCNRLTSIFENPTSSLEPTPGSASRVVAHDGTWEAEAGDRGGHQGEGGCDQGAKDDRTEGED